MKKKILVSKQQWCDIDEITLALAQQFETIAVMLEELKNYVNDKFLDEKISRIHQFALAAYKDACKYNHELLNKFDY